MKKTFAFIAHAFLFSFACLNASAQNLLPPANTSLSNLSAATAINHTLQPNTTGTKNLGSPAKKWKNLYLSGNLQSDSATLFYLQSQQGSVNSFLANSAVIENALSVYGVGIYSHNPYTGGLGIRGIGESAGLRGESIKDGVSGYSPKWVGVRGTCDEYPGTGVLAFGPWEGIFSSGYAIGIKATGYNEAGVIGISDYGYGGDFYSGGDWGLLAETGGGDYAGVFHGDVFTSGSYLPSDKNIKRNMRDFTSAMDIIDKLKPKYYEYKADTIYAFLNLPKGNHYGLLAQDLEQVLPGLVKQSAHQIHNRNIEAPLRSTDGKFSIDEEFAKQREAAIATANKPKDSITIKAVNYTELIPIMIKAMQEQQFQIKELKTEKDKQITNLQSQVDELKSILSKSGNAVPVASSSGYLKQNIPNPAKSNTVISYYVPNNTGRAKINVTDIEGRLVKVYNALAGEGQVTIKRSSHTPDTSLCFTIAISIQSPP